MPVTTSSIAPALLPGLRKIKGLYPQIKTQWGQVYATGHSDMQVEKTAHFAYLPTAQLKVSGGPTNFDQAAGARYTYNHIHIAVGLGYAFTREAIDDNLYKTQFDPTNLGLMNQFRITKETVAANVFNVGNAVTPGIGGDGLALFSTAHTIDGGTVANMPTTAVPLNENTLLMANNMIRRFKDYRNNLISAQGKMLVVPVELRHIAARLFNTPLRTGTANNDVSVIRENQDLSSGYLVMDYLTSPYAWFVLSDQGGFIHLQRVPFESSMQVEFTTDNLLVKGYERYYLGYDDWRAGWATFPTN